MGRHFHTVKLYHANMIQSSASARFRLDRLYKGSVYKAEPQQLQLHLNSAGSIIDDLVSALADLVPEDEG